MPTENQRASKFRSDLQSIYGRDIHVQNLIDSQRGQSKPYDSYVVYEGKMIGIEFKRVTGQSINGNIMRDCQVKGLQEVAHNGYSGLIIIFLDHANWQNKKLFCMPIFKFLKVFRGVHVGGGVHEWGPAIKIKELEEKCPEYFILKSKQDCFVKVRNAFELSKRLHWNFSDFLNLDIFR